MTTVADFLIKPEELVETREIKVCDKMPVFKIKALTGTEMELAQKAGMVRKPGKGGRQEETQDLNKVQDKFVELSVITPDLQNAELQEFYGTIGNPAGTARAMLLAGQFVELSAAIQELSGFGDEEDVIEESKN